MSAWRLSTNKRSLLDFTQPNHWVEKDAVNRALLTQALESDDQQRSSQVGLSAYWQWAAVRSRSSTEVCKFCIGFGRFVC